MKSNSPEKTKSAEPDVLTVSTRQGAHSSRSGYQLLAEYIPSAQSVWADRREPRNFLLKSAARLLRKRSFSRWYLGGCAQLEFKALRRILAGYKGIVHLLWADHDLGYLDKFLNRKNHRLVGTFHLDPDLLRAVIRFPNRLKRFDAIILMCEAQREFFLKSGVEPSRLHVVLHGVDTAYFQPQPRITNNPFTVLSVGTHRRDFGMLRSVVEEFQSSENIHFQIVANPKVNQLFDGLKNATVMSRLTDSQLLNHYQQASCLLQLVEAATANNVLLEGMSCGLPVVSQAIGGIPDYVTPEHSLLVQRDDVQGVVDALSMLASDAMMQNVFSTASRSRACDLNWNITASKTCRVYETCALPD